MRSAALGGKRARNRKAASACRSSVCSRQNTVDEVRLVAAELGRVGGDQVIIVTSKAHSRRVRVTWSAVVGSSPRAIIRYAEEEPYHSGSWWRNTRDALDVSREVLGLMNVWAGFPVQPDRQGR